METIWNPFSESVSGCRVGTEVSRVALVALEALPTEWQHLARRLLFAPAASSALRICLRAVIPNYRLTLPVLVKSKPGVSSSGEGGLVGVGREKKFKKQN